jgi:hypothetical protein
MSKRSRERMADENGGLTARLRTIRDLNKISATRERRRASIQQIVSALVAAGYVSLDERAKALGVNRSTAWNIISARNKLGRLNAKTTARILANSETPETVRILVRRYLDEESVE